jgi:predicted ATPase
VKGAPPYIPFIETLEFAARVLPRDLLRHYLGESASEIARLMPELRRMYPDIPPPIELPPEQQRRYLFNAYREFVDRAAGLTPIVVVFEDLHWADEASLLLLRHLAQSVSIIPVLMIGTYRDVDLDVNRPFAGALESWVREKLATRLTLRRFGLAAVQELLTSLSGKKPPDSLVSIIHAETDGNPFFVEEVYHHLNEEGKLFDEAGGWQTGLRSGELEVPQGVRLVIGRRLQRLQEPSRRILTTAAIAGRSFDLLAGSAGAEPSRRRARRDRRGRTREAGGARSQRP